MALSYVGGTSGGGTGASYTVSLNGTLTGGSASSPAEGDLILVFTGEANGASVTSTCSGNTAGAYSTIRAHQNQADTHDANLDSFYKFAGATPDTTLTITRGSNNTTYGSATVVHVWRGADSANPFNVTPTIAASANGSAANPAAITPTTAGSVVLYCGHASQLAASGTAYTTAGTHPISLKFDGSTGDSIVMASHYTAWTTGAYDPAAFAGSTTATTLGWVALTVVINPATPVAKTATSTLGGAVRADQTKTASLGGAVQTSDTKTATLGAIVVTQYTATASLSGVVKATQTATAGIQGAILETRTSTAGMDGAVSLAQTKTASLGAAIAQAQSATASLSGAVRAAVAATATLDAALAEARTATAGLDGHVQAANTITATASLSGAIQQQNTASATLSAAIAAAREATASIDAAIATPYTRTASLDAQVAVTFTASAALEGAIIAAQSASAGLSGFVFAGTPKSHTAGLDAAIRATGAASAGLSAYIDASVTITQQQVEMLTDIWQRLGLDPAAPLTETETEASFGGIVLEKSGADIITSTRSGISASGNPDLMIRDIWRRLGLDAATPMTAAADRIVAGWLEQTITPTASGVVVTRIDPPYTATPGYFVPGYLENQE